MRLLLPMLLVACAEEDIPLSPAIDADRDGFDETTDCDDEAPTIHPNADELCDEIDNDCDGAIDELGAADAPTWFRDADGDGFANPEDTITACEMPEGYVDAASGFECDDDNFDANPDAEEVCDGADNDCDGNTDEGTASDAVQWYLDSDGDGYGIDWEHQMACEAPSGYVVLSGDCDDDDPDVNPGASEVCDGEGKDEDCDDASDDEDDSVSGTTPWYPDLDGDGYGETDSPVEACEAPTDYTDTLGDCDDDDPVINPDNAETCGDGVDNDCDGDIDEDDAPYPLQWYADADSDGYGNPAVPGPASCSQPSGYVDNATDCDDFDADINPGEAEQWYDGIDQDCDGGSDDDADGDGYDALLYGGSDCDDSEDAAYPGMAELCGDGIDNDCDGEVDTCTIGVTLTGEDTGDRFGGAFAGSFDWNGDGASDLAVGADRQEGGGAGRGAVYVWTGPLTASVDASTAGAAITGEADHDRAGTSLASLGDLDGDGYDDLVIGAFGEDTGGAEGGAAYVVYGPRNGTDSLSTAGVGIIGEVAADNAGWAVAGPGDASGDGTGDVLIGSYGQDAGGTGAGAAYLVQGPITASIDLSFAETRLVGAAAGEQAGWAVAGGDIDGDGISDVIVGATYLQSGGAYVGGAYLVTGPVTTAQMSLDEADGTWIGSTAGDLAGYAVAMAGDIDNDGLNEVLVGAPEEDTSETSAGAVYLLDGTSTGSYSLDEAGAVILGENGDDYLGCSVAGAGDVDADDTPDIVIGGRLDDWSDSDAGAAYVLLGPISGSLSATDGFKIVGYSTGDWLGDAVGGPGDLDDDGVDDVVIGAPLDDDYDSNAGVVFIVGGW